MTDHALTTDTTDPTPTGEQPDLEMRDRYMREIVEHRRLVGKYLAMVAAALMKRAVEHDLSKFGPDEFAGYLEAYPTFCRADYDSDLYREACRIAGPALKHHVTTNDHHPEFFGELGIDGMHLVQVVEMFFDWMAASMRNGREDDLSHFNLAINVARFSLSPQLAHILANTRMAFEEGGFA